MDNKLCRSLILDSKTKQTGSCVANFFWIAKVSCLKTRTINLLRIRTIKSQDIMIYA